MKYTYGGYCDIGYSRKVNEDFIDTVELGEHTVFSIVADGAGSLPGALQPASIVCSEILYAVRRVYGESKDLFLSNPGLFLKEAMHTANRVLGAFKLGNEERYSGYGASVTCCLLDEQERFTFAHAGNTRFYLIRTNPKDHVPAILQLSRDHTKAQKMLEEGTLLAEQYYGHPDRLRMTSGLGISTDPLIQTYTTKLKSSDILLITSDGVHYAIRPDAMMNLVLKTGNCNDAARTLVEAAKFEKYADNMSAMLVYCSP